MEKKVALITGATSMIGRSCVQLFTEKGMKLMLVGRSQEKLNALARDRFFTTKDNTEYV